MTSVSGGSWLQMFRKIFRENTCNTFQLFLYNFIFLIFSKPRSPSERKIGLVRRRSQEMALKKVLIKDEKNKYVLPAPNIVDDVKLTQLKRGKPNTFRIKPSPMKIENSTPDGRKTTRIKISFREGQLQSPRVHIKVRILNSFYIF